MSFFALWVAAVTNWAKTENNEGKEKPTAGEVVREACRVICKVGQVERVPEFYSEDFEADYPMTERGRGLPGVAALAESVRNILPGYAEHIDELVEAGYEVVVRLTITGNEPRKGAGVRFRDVSMLTVRNGKICREEIAIVPNSIPLPPASSHTVVADGRQQFSVVFDRDDSVPANGHGIGRQHARVHRDDVALTTRTVLSLGAAAPLFRAAARLSY